MEFILAINRRSHIQAYNKETNIVYELELKKRPQRKSLFKGLLIWLPGTGSNCRPSD